MKATKGVQITCSKCKQFLPGFSQKIANELKREQMYQVA
jgi:hypothetical protein